MKKHYKSHWIVWLSVFALPATAESFTASLADNLGPLNGGSLSYSITSPGASLFNAATLTFDLMGYGSVDGNNSGKDTFTLTVNGEILFSGGFDMGGGPDAGGDGSNFINYIAPGVNILSSTTFGAFQGGLTQFSVDHTLIAGINSYVFDYGVMEGLINEGWWLSSALIVANVNSVPIPSAMLLFGTGLVGFLGAQFKRKR